MHSVQRLSAAAGSFSGKIDRVKQAAPGAPRRDHTHWSCFLSAVAGAALALAVPGARAETVAGVTAGALSVESSGAARYVVPIDVPPGVAGMEPDLSLVYNSGGGNGLLGVGWSLGGLSVIHRCARTLAQDGVNGGVNLDAGDRFCLDGQRLIAVSGAYGADGTEYRTEIDGFARIISYGSAGTGPESFTVETRSRRILEYGVTADSRLEAEGGATVRFWALNRVFDPMGNVMDLVYDENTPDRTFKIQRIDYTANSAAGTTPQSRVAFVYEARPDHRSAYLAGSRLDTTERLQRIETWTDGALVREYRLAYHDDTVTGLSRLASVTECDGGTRCLVPITFDWEAEPAGFVEEPGYALPSTSGALGREGAFTDLNGDGRLDYLYGRDSTRKAWLNTGTGWAEDAGFQPPAAFWIYKAMNKGNGNVGEYPYGLKRGTLVDVNGDGLQDFVQAYASAASARTTWINTGSGWKIDAGYQPPFQTSYDARQWYEEVRCPPEGTCKKRKQNYYVNRDLGDFVDLNGDGLLDFAAAYSINDSEVRRAWINTGSGWVEDATLTPAGVTVLYNDYIDNEGTVRARRHLGTFVDVNGDGRADLVQAHPGYQKTWLNTAAGWLESAAYQAPFSLGYNIRRTYRERGCEGHRCDRTFYDSGSFNGVFVDLNGDGLIDRLQASDIFDRAYSNKRRVVFKAWLNTGAGWVEDAGFQPPVRNYVIHSSSVPDGQGEAEVADVNADGLPDYVQSYSTVRKTWLNTGTGWLESAAHEVAADLGIYWPESDGKHPNNASGRQEPTIRGVLRDVDGDGRLDVVHVNGNTRRTDLADYGAVGQVTGITDSLGRVTTIDYAPLTEAGVYTKGTGAVFPELDLQVPLYVVGAVSTDDGVGGQARESYAYEALKLHVQGRGALGFARMTALDEQTGIETVTDYRQDFPFIGAVEASETRLADGTRVRTLANTWTETPLNGGLTRFPHVSTATAAGYEINDGPGNAPVATATTATLYDDFGNPTRVTAATSGAGETFETVTDNVYGNDTVNWFLGQLDRATATSTLPDLSAETRVAAFAHDPQTGLLTREVIEPDRPALKLTTTYTHDVFGNLLTETVGGPDVAARTTARGFSADGRFATGLTNALGHGETRAFDARFGTVTRLTGPNGLTTTWAYDGFGRKTKEAREDGTETRWRYDLCVAQCPPGGVYAVSQQDFDSASGTPIGPRAVEYFDALNRSFRAETEGFDGTRVFADTTFNARGEVVATTRPYFAGTAAAEIQSATATHDVLGRVLSVTRPDQGVESVVYDGLTSVRTNALNQDQTRKGNARGELVEVTDNLGTTIAYRYDPFGNLAQTARRALGDPGPGVVTTMDYDVRGLKTSMDDPDMGRWTYDYNVLGELVTQTDPKGQSVALFYDVLGRLTQRVEPEGTTDWSYDTAAKGVGKLHGVSAPHSGYAMTQSYDSLGRPGATTTTIDGITYTQSVTYDPAGRPEVLTYPSGFAVRNVYNARGYLASVAEDGGATVFWRAEAVNAEGQVTREAFGNGAVTTNAFDPRTGRIDSITTDLAGAMIQDLAYDFDKLGNLKTRSDRRQDRAETFLYDGLNRLTSATLVDTAPGGGTRAITSYGYNALGNLDFKSDVGAYFYGGAGAGPHAVTEAGGKTYLYDAKGNLTERRAGGAAELTLAYASFDKPTLIRETATGNEAGFVYGPDRARIKQRIVENSLVREVVYLGGLYERRTRIGSPDELVHYIVAGTTVAIHTIFDDNLPATDRSRYLHRDHLGSVESITGETGVVVQRLSFDAHGKRRLADWTAGDPAGPDAETPRGFTGHEHLDSVGLIHMNGRVYDPALGRFLSADPFVPNPTATQSFNRYTYVYNNPLSYTDPSGFRAFGPAIGNAIADAVEKSREAQNDVQGERSWLDDVKDFFTKSIVGRSILGALKGAVLGGLSGGPIGAAAGAFTGLVETGFTEAALGLLGQVINGGKPSDQSYGDGPEGNNNDRNSIGSYFQEAIDSVVNQVSDKFSEAVDYLDQVYSGLSTLDKVQLTLELASVGLELSGIGLPLAMAVDLVNTIISAARGDLWGTVLGLGSIIPLVGLAANAGRIYRFFKRACASFEGETLVETEEGLVPIKDIEAEEHRVLARDEETGEMAYKPVVAQFWNNYSQTVYITIRDLETGTEQTIVSNRSHPFYVADVEALPRLVAAGGSHAPVIGTNETGRWVDAENLVAGHRLLNADEGWSEVTAVRVEHKPLRAYNLTVADFHTFFVKAPEANDNDAVWVHNCPGRDVKGRFTSAAGGNNPANVRGKEAHKNYPNALGSSYQYDVVLPSGRKPDGVNFETRVVRELKPDSPKAISYGRRQVERYRQELQEIYPDGPDWTSEIDTYRR